ncbi:MAG: CapA family protein [Prevotella sp.]|nr:CapA family protein [Prevotella sp.]
MISIFIAGDIVPRNRTIDLFKQKRTDDLFHDFIPHIKDADISIGNLEAPIIDGNPTPIKKSGLCLHAPKETMEVIKEAGFNTITLANNHFRDQGQQGIECTIQYAKENSIDFVGGGATLLEARKILYKRIKDETIAIINVCEHEFSIATEEYGGSNPLDLINLYEDINTAKKQANYVLVIIHGGIEGYQLPTPRMKRTYRHLIDLGADAVVNHHQHCFSGYELYKKKPIFYGLGNFCFDWEGRINSIWNEGIAIRLTFDNTLTFDLLPYTQCNDNPCVAICPTTLYNDRINILNEVIQNDQALEEDYFHFIKNRKKTLLLDLLPIHNKYLYALIRRGIIHLPYNEKDLIRIKNKICCESHYDNLSILLNKIIDSKGF